MILCLKVEPPPVVKALLSRVFQSGEGKSEVGEEHETRFTREYSFLFQRGLEL